MAAEPAKRQKHRRYPVNIQVTRYDGDSVCWQSVNLSVGGVFVKGPPFLPQGEELEIGLWLPSEEGFEELITRARVAWLNNPNDEDQDPTLPAGMALEFLELDADDRKDLRDYLRSLASAAPIPTPPGTPTPTSPAHPTGPGQGPGDFLRDPSALATNDLLGSYRILRRLGSGGMGSVYIAEHQSIGRKVALKTLHSRYAHDPSVVRRFFDEARVVNQINNENIIEITDFVSDRGLHYFVMELLEGRNIAEAQAEDGQFNAARILTIGVQLCGALKAAHEAGVTHRDLKPDNIILTERSGNPDFVKLLDFGVAKLNEHQGSMNQTGTGMVLGTPGYMAPEQVVEGKTDHRADIYAFGVVLYQMVTGKKPFVADTWPQMVLKQTTQTPPPLVSTIPGGLPVRLENLIMACLERSADDRPQSMADIGEELRAIAATLDITLPGLQAGTGSLTYGRGHGFLPKRRRRRLLPVALGGAALLAATGLAAAVFLYTKDAPKAGHVAVDVGSRAKDVEVEAAPAVTGEEKQEPAATRPTRTKASPPSRPRATSRPPTPTPSKRSENRTTASSETAFRSNVVRQLLRQKNYREALKVCTEILKRDAKHALTYRNMGIAYTGLGAKAQACESYRRYLRYAPNAPDRQRVKALLSRCP